MKKGIPVCILVLLFIHLCESSIMGPIDGKTPLFGTDKIGKAFSWKTSLRNADIREISGKDGFYIDRIKVRTIDGYEEESSPSIGGNGGDAYTWKVPEGQYISKVLYRQGSWLDSVTFVTNRGTQSPQFGGNGGGGPFEYVLPENNRLNGIYGFNDQYVRGLGFYYSRFEKVTRKTPEFGNSNMGEAFSWKTTLKNAEIRQIQGKDGFYIDRIKVKTVDGDEEESSPAIGGNGGGPYKWVVPDGQYIAKLEYRQGAWLDGVTFITNKGTRSPQFGGEGGAGPFVFELPPDTRLDGIFGHRDQYIRGLGFYYSKFVKAYQKTPLFGTDKIGNAFEWKTTLRNAEIREIVGRDGFYIDQIKVKTVDRNEEESSPHIGGNGGSPYTWTVPEDQYIAKIVYRQGSWLDGITFVTNKGTQSPVFGGNGGGGPFEYVLPEGTRLNGIFGFNDQYVRGLGFYYSKFKEIVLQKTPEFGNPNMGQAFSWKTSLKNAQIRQIQGKDGFYIDRIKVKTVNGTEEESSPAIGGNGGGPYKWVVPDGEFIVKLEYRQGSWLDGVTFITNKGTRSPQFGGEGGAGPFEFTLPPTTRLSGFYGHRDQYIRGLGFYYQ